MNRYRVLQLKIIFLVLHSLFAQAKLGGVFPIPLLRFQSDPSFTHCPGDHGIYAHTTNCSLFHLCSFGVHRVYACLEGFYYNPISKRCQFSGSDQSLSCHQIVQAMMEINFYPIDETIGDFNSTDYRKSMQSTCVHPGIYPDIFDCSLFHWCHVNGYHQIRKCPGGLHFDPKTTLCLSSRLVDCQYEPPLKIDDERDVMCRASPPGSFLPVPGKLDEFLICQEMGRIINMKCKSGYFYNALTTTCENGPCTFDSTLCKNEGQCVDEPKVSRGFRCVCSSPFYGPYCENIHPDMLGALEQTTGSEFSSKNQLIGISLNETTHVPFIDSFNHPRQNQSILIHPVFDQSFGDELSSDEDFFYHDGNYDEIIKVILSVTSTCIALIILISILYAVWRWIRCYLYPPMDSSSSEWNILAEESKV